MFDDIYPNASFENERWSTAKQKIEYRHRAALERIPARTQTLLDVGCGEGTFLAMMFKKYPTVHLTGIDFSSVGLSVAKSKVPECTYVQIDVSKSYPFKDNSFDVVVALDVLEHSLEPEKILSEIKRIVKNKIIISVPNFSSLPARVQMMFGKVPENNRRNKGHMYWFNYEIVLSLLTQNGLKIVEITGNHQLQRVPLVGAVIKRLRALFPRLLSLSFIIVAEK